MATSNYLPNSLFIEKLKLKITTPQIIKQEILKLEIQKTNRIQNLCKKEGIDINTINSLDLLYQERYLGFGQSSDFQNSLYFIKNKFFQDLFEFMIHFQSWETWIIDSSYKNQKRKKQSHFKEFTLQPLAGIELLNLQILKIYDISVQSVSFVSFLNSPNLQQLCLYNQRQKYCPTKSLIKTNFRDLEQMSIGQNLIKGQFSFDILNRTTFSVVLVGFSKLLESNHCVFSDYCIDYSGSQNGDKDLFWKHNLFTVFKSKLKPRQFQQLLAGKQELKYKIVQSIHEKNQKLYNACFKRLGIKKEKSHLKRQI